MISNIVSASQSLYEEVDSGIEIYKYTTSNGKTTTKVIISTSGSSNISTNLQTLVSNGFLAGSNNDCSGAGCSNKNKKKLLDPKTKNDIGNCKIKIIKKNSGGKVIYKVKDNSYSSNCPTSYEKGVK